ncbi:MAG: recombination protein RecA, partial [Myxococcota bacterium]
YEGDLLDLASERDIIQKSGSWYSYKGDRIGQGRENTKSFMEGQPEMCVEVERAILEAEGLLEDATEELAGTMSAEVN